jgi:hypothetical protein
VNSAPLNAFPPSRGITLKRTPPVVYSAPAEAVSTLTSCVPTGLMFTGVVFPFADCPTVSIPFRSKTWSVGRPPWIATFPVGDPDDDEPPTSWLVRAPRETPGISDAMS